MSCSKVFIGLACRLAGIGDLNQFAETFFSPLATAFLRRDCAPLQDVDLLLKAQIDAGLSLPVLNESRLALFALRPGQDGLPLSKNSDLQRLLSLNYEPVYANNVEELLASASETIDSEAVDFALIYASYGQSSIAFVLCNESLAKTYNLRAYASYEFGTDKNESQKLGFLASAHVPAVLSEELDSQLSHSGTYYSDIKLAASAFGTDFRPEFCDCVALMHAIIALFLRVLPRNAADARTNASPLLKGKTISYEDARPWIHPYSLKATDNSQRRAAVLTHSGAIFLREFACDLENHSSFRLLRKRSSELFLFSAKNSAELVASIQSIDWNNLDLAELAYDNFLRAGELRDESNTCRLAVIASSESELRELLSAALLSIAGAPNKVIPLGRRATGFAYSPDSKALRKNNKIAFVLPGLGASYPNMLSDLSFYFPEVRGVFDFVERLAVRAKDPVIPSQAVFTSNAGSQTISQAILATIDSAVITLLLAEWALFHLLQRLGINPDVFLGCSTGEFGVLTMSGAFDIFASAEPFYRLSTHVSRSVPKDELSKLRTIRVSAPYEGTVESLVRSLEKPVYLFADMSQSCCLISGERSTMDLLCAGLTAADLDFLVLPIAIPYHTPLVAGKLDHGDEDIVQLAVQAPDRESWSCSIDGKYPADAAAILKATLSLFEKPIKLRSTVEKMYAEGTRTFIELGPKGGLVPYMAEVLSGRPHTVLAANLAERTGIDQLHYLLASLFVEGVDLNLSVLFDQRFSPPHNLQFAELDDDFDAEHYDESVQLYDDYEGGYAFPQQSFSLEANAPRAEDLAFGSEDVLLSYLSNLQSFHNSMMQASERLMQAYLLTSDDLADDLQESLDEDAALPLSQESHLTRLPAIAKCPFLKGARVDHSVPIKLSIPLSTRLFPFVLDHAIGGRLSSVEQESRVYLLPLMVAIEMMAEAASLLFPAAYAIELSDVRALKRIRVGADALNLIFLVEQRGDDSAFVRIFDGGIGDADLSLQDKSEKVLLCSSMVKFANAYPIAPAPNTSTLGESRRSKLSPSRLYADGSMFHGPLMQAVQSIDTVSSKAISGKISASRYESWFADPELVDLGFILDPLVIDNLSQFVLYQMYEHDLDAAALLPFHIASIKIYDDLDLSREKLLDASVQMLSMSKRGTLASMQLKSGSHNLLVDVSEISSRAIMLPEGVKKIVFQPQAICCDEERRFSENSDAIITKLASVDFPDEDTVLDWLTDYVLCDNEQKDWLKLGKNEKRRKHWLMGRVAAKDAVRLYLQREYGQAVNLTDLSIEANDEGAVRVRFGRNTLANVQLPAISIAHCDNIAFACASKSVAGIDVEEVRAREDGFEILAFSASEKKLLGEQLADEYMRQSTAFWSAKEASAKAHKTGFMGDPKNFKVVSVDSTRGEIFVAAPPSSGINTSDINAYVCSIKFDHKYNVAIALVCGYINR